jgi:peptidoglycan/LPS O-acetylase OafA/YrhL
VPIALASTCLRHPVSVAKSGRRWAPTLAGLVLCVLVPVVAFSSPSVTGEQGTVDCGPTLSAIFLIFPSDPAPGEAWAIEPCNAALGTRWLLMMALAGVGAALLWFGREKPARHVVLPPLGG